MTVTGTQARYELTASADPDATGVSGGLTIGTPISTVTYATAPDIVYSLVLQIAAGATLTLDTATGIVTGTIAGTNQVETATVVAASGITGNGNATVVFTSAIVTGSPVTLTIPVTTASNTATLVATAIKAFINSNASAAGIIAKYTIAGTGAAITATAIDKAANDTTLNISIANGTCTGITTAATSANTTPGVATSMAYRISGTVWDAVDAEGVPLAGAVSLHGMLIKSDSGYDGEASISGGSQSLTLYGGGIALIVGAAGDVVWAASSIDFSAIAGDVLLYLDIHAGT